MKISSKLQLAGLIVFVLLAAGLVIFTSQTTLTTSISTSTQAAANTPAKCNCTDPNNCYPDGCSGKPKTPDNKLDSDRYDQVCKNINFGWPPDIEVQKYFCSIKQPDSCFDVYQYKDDRYACFMERWFCHPSLCEGAGGNGDCGKYWRLPDGWTSYGCVKGPDNNHLTPIWGLPPNLPGGQQPTNPPQATNTPIPTNTSIPRQPTNTPVPPNPTHTTAPNQPTNTPPPTNTPVPNAPTNVPTNAAPIAAPSGNQPIGINPQEPTVTNEPLNVDIMPDLPSKQEVVASLEKTTAKPLAVVNTSYDVVVSADKQLESFAESWIFKLRIFLLKALK